MVLILCCYIFLATWPFTCVALWKVVTDMKKHMKWLPLNLVLQLSSTSFGILKMFLLGLWSQVPEFVTEENQWLQQSLTTCIVQSCLEDGMGQLIKISVHTICDFSFFLIWKCWLSEIKIKNGLSGFKHRIRNKVQKLISKVTATLNFEVHWECLMYVSVLQTFWLQVLATCKCSVTVSYTHLTLPTTPYV